MKDTPQESRFSIRLALDPYSWRADDRAGWAMTLAHAADAAAPDLAIVESIDIGDTLVYIRMRAYERPQRLKKRLRDDETFIRLRARLADLDARAEYEIDDDPAS